LCVSRSLLGAARHDELGHEDLHHFVALIVRDDAHQRDASIRPRPRGNNLLNLAFDAQDVARSGRSRPGELDSGADDSAGQQAGEKVEPVAAAVIFGKGEIDMDVGERRIGVAGVRTSSTR